ncbi:MAG: CBS domain-containing protein [Planctomycetaceae bacterium]
MNTEVSRLQEDKTLLDAARLFLNHEVTQIYVSSADDEFLGILTDYALIKARLAGLEWNYKLERLISRSVLTVSAEQDIPSAMPLFREGREMWFPYCTKDCWSGNSNGVRCCR